MKSSIEILNEVHDLGKTHPDLYEAVKVEPKILVAAIVDLAGKLEQFRQSKRDEPIPDLTVPAQDLTRGNLQGKLHKVLSAAGTKEQEVGLKIHQFLSSFE